MSANYWASSQRAQWQFTKDQLNSLRLKILLWEKQRISNSVFTVRYNTNMRIYIHQMIAKLGRRLSLRQVVLSTAEVYISRFLTRVSLLEVNLYMLIAAAVYLACKICESPQHIRSVSSEARNCWPEFVTVDFTKLAELEFYLIEEMECYMIIHHPYTSLMQLSEVLGYHDANALMSGAGMSFDESQIMSPFKIDLTAGEVENAWQIINDSYMTDLPLLYPPHVIAVAAIHLTLVLRLNVTDFDRSPEGKSGKGHVKSGSNNGVGVNTKNGNSSSSDPLMSFIMDGVTNSNTSSMKYRNGAKAPTDAMLTSAPLGNSTSTSNNNSNSGVLRRKMATPTTGKPYGHSSNRSSSTAMSVSLSPEKQSSPSVPVPEEAAVLCGPSLTRLDTYTDFLAASNVNLAEVMESVQELLALYDAWQQYDEGSVRQGMKMLLTALHNSQLKQ